MFGQEATRGSWPYYWVAFEGQVEFRCLGLATNKKLLGAPGLTTRLLGARALLGAPGIATARSILTTSARRY